MRPSLKTYGATLFLFVAAAVIGGYYFLVFKPSIEERERIEAFEKRFFHADPDRVMLINVESGDRHWNIARQSGGTWTLGDEVPADPAAVQNLFQAIAGGAVEKIVGDREDRKRFGFDRSEVTIKLGFRDRVEVLELAGKNPASTGFYGYARGLDRIFLVKEAFVEDVRNSLFDLRDRRIFKELVPDRVAGITINRSKDTIDLVRTDAGWQMRQPFAGPADPGEIAFLLREIRLVKAGRFEAWQESFDGIEPRLSLALRDGTGALLVSVDVLFWGTEWFKGMLVHRPGDANAAVVRREFWNLLDSYGFRFADRRLLEFDPSAVTEARFFRDGAWTVISRSGNDWHLDGRRLDGSRVAALLERLNRWKARGLVKEDRRLGIRQVAVEIHHGGGVDRVEVSNFDMQHEVSKTPVFARKRGEVGSEKVDFWLSHSTRLRTGAVVSLLGVRDVFSALDEVLR